MPVIENPLMAWKEALDDAWERVSEAHFEDQGRICIAQARKLLALAHKLNGTQPAIELSDALEEAFLDKGFIVTKEALEDEDGSE